jgi:hypothetical protein
LNSKKIKSFVPKKKAKFQKYPRRYKIDFILQITDIK